VTTAPGSGRARDAFVLLVGRLNVNAMTEGFLEA
jgi:hypothetical protein